MQYCFSHYRKGIGYRYELALYDGIDWRIVWKPGYESHDLIDILRACWYLKSGGRIKDGLSAWQQRILCQIVQDVPGEYQRYLKAVSPPDDRA